MSLTYVKGDATLPQGVGTKVICHCCNDQGQWGSGFVLALSRRWPEPEASYRKWYQDRLHWPREYPTLGEGIPFDLGMVQFVKVTQDIWVANIIGQHKTIREIQVPIRYEAIREGLTRVQEFAEGFNPRSSIHMPRMGAGLARGKWSEIEPLIEQTLVHKGLSVTVYDL